ncbi:MAG TPA: PHP domain-containing protein, partial [Novosphingobium sp.]|nr:PHP domain-containing protein [Novosphingobium sp.]
MAYSPFVPLRVFSSYTMLDGAIDPKAMAKLAKGRGFPAMAVTDRNGLYCAPAFAGACKDTGVQPIVGTLLSVARPADMGGATGGIGAMAAPIIDSLALLAQNETGWLNLCHLVSQAHLERPLEFDPHVQLAALEGHSDGLICLTGAGQGALTRLLAEQQQSAAELYADRLQALFGDRLYVELARTGDPAEEAGEAALIDLAYARGLPLVATNPAHFAEAKGTQAHDAMLCIAGSTHVDAPERARSNPQCWVKPAETMAQLFADCPEALANTLVVAQRCAYMPPRRKPLLPSLAGDKEGEERMLVDLARTGLAQRLAPYWPGVDEATLDKALATQGDERLAAYEALRPLGVGEDFLEY